MMIDLTSYPRNIVVSRIIQGIEVWRPLDGFTDIYVSTKGRVCSTRNNGVKILKDRADEDGYRIITIRQGKQNKTYKVHRLVALTFIINPYNYPLVNHINGDKSKNNVENLEWSNHSMNANEAIRIGLIKVEPIMCYDLEGNLLHEYTSRQELKDAGYKYNNVYACLTKRTARAYGLIWKYKSECWIV